MVTFSWVSFTLALLKAAPAFIQFLAALKQSADADANRGIGYQQAVGDGLALQTRQMQESAVAVAEARANQAAHPNSDDGRDTSFRRD